MEKLKSSFSNLNFSSSASTAKFTNAFRFNSDHDVLRRSDTRGANPFTDGPTLEEVRSPCTVLAFRCYPFAKGYIQQHLGTDEAHAYCFPAFNYESFYDHPYRLDILHLSGDMYDGGGGGFSSQVDQRL